MRYLLLLAVAGCFSPTYPEGVLCGPAPDECPPDQTCGPDGRCHAGPVEVDAPPGTPDTGPGTPDAAPATPDATPGIPDATVPEPDAACGTSEICNGVDDDCDEMVDEGFGVGDPCDGGDGDACEEGTLQCAGGAAMCDEPAETDVETCNAVDDDCDGTTDEGWDFSTDITNCGGCGIVCSNAYGSTGCMSSMCVPICTTGAMDCDGDAVNGCEQRNTNPACAAAATDLGDLTGDSTVAGGYPVTASATGFGEAWYLVSLRETVALGGAPIEARVSLDVPSGVDFDLFVHCQACGGVLAGSSTNVIGVNEQVDVARTDISGDASYDVLIEVRFISGTVCGDYTLTVEGGTGVASGTCL